MTRRNPNIEVLRCLLMFLIVLYHCYVHGIYSYGGVAEDTNSLWTVLFSTLIIWHVDGFVAISGWFGINFTWKKFLSLYATIAFYAVLGLCGWYLTDRGSFHFSSTFVFGGWFGSSYLLLMLMAPLLNQIQGKGMGLFALGMLLAWIPRNLVTSFAPSPAGIESCSMMTLIFVYLVARFARQRFTTPIPLRKLLLSLAAFPIVTFLVGATEGLRQFLHGNPISGSVFHTCAYYYAPHVVLFAVALLLLFVWYVRVPNWLGRACVFMGPSMFGVYLLHDATPWGAEMYRRPEQWLDAGGLNPILVVFICAVLTFAACLCMDLLRRAMLRLLVKMKGRVLHEIE